MSKRSCPPALRFGLESLESRRLLSLTVQIDYRYDIRGFFDSQVRRDTLQAAVNSVTARINDHFAEIKPSGNNTWTAEFGHPSGYDNPSGVHVIELKNPVVPADTMILYPGAEEMGSNVLATNARSLMGDHQGTAAWGKLVETRGRTPTQFGIVTPAIGAMTFSSTANWYSGVKIDGIKSNQYDLYSVAVHELGHILGIGGGQPWANQLNATGDAFLGPAAVAAFGEPVPADWAHWQYDVRIDGQLASLTAQPAGMRKEFTRLDYAALKDFGYDITMPAPVLGKYGNLAGYAYDDLNNNGKRDSGEGFAALAFLDKNDDGIFNGGEPAVTANANGYFIISSAPAGTYRLGMMDLSNGRVIKNYVRTLVTVKSDQRVQVADTAFVAGKPLYLYGQVFNDLDKDGQLDTGEAGRSGVTVYLDADRDGVMDDNEPRTVSSLAGSFDFMNVPSGFYSFRVVLPPGTVQTTVDHDFYASSTSSGGIGPFGVADVVTPTASISGFTFDDTNLNSQYDAGEPKTAGKVVFLDLDNDDVLDPGEKSVKTAADGSFSFTNLPGGSYHVRRVFPSGYVLSTGPVNVTLAAGETLAGVGIGSRPKSSIPTVVASISGFTFDDKNANGSFDAGDVKTSGKVVFLDTNSNGKLDSGEKSVKTAADGSWKFSGLSAGTYHVRRVFPSGYTYSTPPVDYTFNVSQDPYNVGIGSKSVATPPVNTASLAGVAFNDTNKNGKYDSGDTLAPGKTIWLDLDDDGVRDASEPSVVTGSDGIFSFKNLAAGKYHVRRVFSPGYAESTSAAYVTLTSGQAVASVLIGSRLK